MVTVLRYGLRQFRGQMIGWGIGLALLGLLLMWFYPTIAEQQDLLEQLMEAYPPEFFAFFGGLADFTTAEGFLSVELFSYLPLVLGIFAVLGGSGLLASGEEQGTLDLVLAYPVSRSALFAGRFLSLLVATAVILTISWLGLAIPTLWISFELSWLELLLPFLPLAAQVLLFASLALLLSMLLPSRRMAAMASGILLVASYFISGLANAIPDLETLAQLSPVTYYQIRGFSDGLNLEWLAGLLTASVLFTAAAWWRFQRRDIRVAGEGGWRLPVVGILPRLRSRVTQIRVPAARIGSAQE